MSEFSPVPQNEAASNDGAESRPPFSNVEPQSAAVDAAVPPGAESAPAPADAESAAELGGSEDDFSAELEVRDAPAADTGALVAGQKVRGKILSIGDDQAIVSLSSRPDAVLSTREFRTADGTCLLRVDDTVAVVVQSVAVPVVLTLDRRRAVLNAARLRIAHEDKKPVAGLVRALNKGGFEVRVTGVRCFCPLSQMDAAFAADPQSHVNKTYNFRILRWEHGGRSIILSRRAILKEEAVTKAAETRKTLAVDAEFDGIVTRIQPFGAFVDIGGIEGLLHVSRMGRGHVTDPASLVAPGQTIRVRVTRIDDGNTGRERIALAATDLGPDPWSALPETLQENAVLRGRVMRLTEFGAFVNLAPGIDGLVHVSELENRAEPDAAPLRPGDEIEVRITRVALDKRRVSLSLRLEPPPPRPAAGEPRPMRGDPRDARRNEGDARPRRDRDRGRDRDRDRDAGRGREPASPFAEGGSLTQTMADQLGALRGKLQIRP